MRSLFDQAPANWISINVLDVALIIRGIPYSVVRKTCLPYRRGTEFLLGTRGKSAFDELNGAFESIRGRDQKMEVFRHNHEFVELVGTAAIGI